MSNWSDETLGTLKPSPEWNEITVAHDPISGVLALKQDGVEISFPVTSACAFIRLLEAAAVKAAS